MIYQPHSKLIAIKQWADHGLFDIVSQNFDRLTSEDASIMLRILDHIHVVDRIFQHHPQGLSHTFQAPRSERVPELKALASSAHKVDNWYASYVDSLEESEFEQPVDFVFTSGKPARMQRGEILLLRSTAMSRANTLMTIRFAGGAIGATLGTYAWSVWHWPGGAALGWSLLAPRYCRRLFPRSASDRLRANAREAPTIRSTELSRKTPTFFSRARASARA